MYLTPQDFYSVEKLTVVPKDIYLYTYRFFTYRFTSEFSVRCVA